jgi:hypothetical protein
MKIITKKTQDQLKKFEQEILKGRQIRHRFQKVWYYEL